MPPWWLLCSRPSRSFTRPAGAAATLWGPRHRVVYRWGRGWVAGTGSGARRHRRRNERHPTPGHVAHGGERLFVGNRFAELAHRLGDGTEPFLVASSCRARPLLHTSRCVIVRRQGGHRWRRTGRSTTSSSRQQSARGAQDQEGSGHRGPHRVCEVTPPPPDPEMARPGRLLPRLRLQGIAGAAGLMILVDTFDLVAGSAPARGRPEPSGGRTGWRPGQARGLGALSGPRPGARRRAGRDPRERPEAGRGRARR
jgi:hypothetical protein